MIKEFSARLAKGDNKGAWTCVVMHDVEELFGARGLVKVRGAIDGEPFESALEILREFCLTEIPTVAST